MRRAQALVQKGKQRVDFGADLRIAVQCVSAGQGQQHKGVVISIAQRIAGRCHQATSVWTKPGSPSGLFALVKRYSSPFSAISRPSGYQPMSAAVAKQIDLPGLHQDAPGCRTIGGPGGIEPVHEAAGRRIPALARPQRQRMLDHELLQVRDDIVWIRSICRRRRI